MTTTLVSFNDEFTSDALAIYVKDVGRRPVLSREEEAEVAARALAGDEDAVRQLIEANLRFVVLVAKRYRNRGVDFDDLVQAGNRGMLRAARRFDPSFGVRFITYAIHWITQEIQLELDANAGNVKPSLTQMVRVRRIRRLQAEARQRLGREYTVAELADLTGYTEDRISEALDYHAQEQSFDAPLSAHDNDSVSLEELHIPADDDIEERELEEARRVTVGRMLDEILTERERLVITEYFGIGGRRESSLNEIGAMLGVSRERARQIKEKALAKLREASGAYPISDVFAPAAGVPRQARPKACVS